MVLNIRFLLKTFPLSNWIMIQFRTTIIELILCNTVDAYHKCISSCSLTTFCVLGVCECLVSLPGIRQKLACIWVNERVIKICKGLTSVNKKWLHRTEILISMLQTWLYLPPGWPGLWHVSGSRGRSDYTQTGGQETGGRFTWVVFLDNICIVYTWLIFFSLLVLKFP